MKEEIKKLEFLREKVESIWKLLDLEKSKEEIFELQKQMQDPNFWQDSEKAGKISKKCENLKKELENWENIKLEVSDFIDLAKELEQNHDADLEKQLLSKIEELEKKIGKLEFYLLLNEIHDKDNAIVSVHAGSGGTEAQDWAEMLLRMLMRFCEKKDWNATLLDETRGSEAGVKSATFRVEGAFAYGYLKSEHGTHRLVRISPFDAEKMRHTSFALIEVVPELEDVEDFEIDPNDLRVDTFMSGGKGGQSVNTTYSAVRIVHIPTNIAVQCQNERSQKQNKESAMKILKSKLQKIKEDELEKEKQKLKGEHKSAEWGSQIRSYVLQPYKMVKDLRSRYETTEVEKVLDGDLEEISESYLKWLKQQ